MLDTINYLTNNELIKNCVIKNLLRFSWTWVYHSWIFWQFYISYYNLKRSLNIWDNNTILKRLHSPISSNSLQAYFTFHSVNFPCNTPASIFLILKRYKPQQKRGKFQQEESLLFKKCEAEVTCDHLFSKCGSKACSTLINNPSKFMGSFKQVVQAWSCN